MAGQVRALQERIEKSDTEHVEVQIPSPIHKTAPELIADTESGRIRPRPNKSREPTSEG